MSVVLWRTFFSTLLATLLRTGFSIFMRLWRNNNDRPWWASFSSDLAVINHRLLCRCIFQTCQQSFSSISQAGFTWLFSVSCLLQNPESMYLNKNNADVCYQNDQICSSFYACKFYSTIRTIPSLPLLMSRTFLTDSKESCKTCQNHLVTI